MIQGVWLPPKRVKGVIREHTIASLAAWGSSALDQVEILKSPSFWVAVPSTTPWTLLLPTGGVQPHIFAAVTVEGQAKKEDKIKQRKERVHRAELRQVAGQRYKVIRHTV